MAMATSINLINKAPELLHLGNLECDEGWFKRASTASTLSTPAPEHKRRKIIIISVLIEHPTEGLILFETGGGKDYPEVWGAPINDVFARLDYEADHELEAQIAKTGHDIKDVKAVIMGHLHLDHAATKTDFGVYIPHFLSFDLKWQIFSGPFLELAQGINLRHAPGHTPGLVIMQVNLAESGTCIFTTDMYHVHENWEDSVPHGWLARDHDDWVRSHQMFRMLQKRTGAKMVLGHCAKTFFSYEIAPHAYS